MRYIFKFPDIGEGLTEGIIIEWYVDKGNAVKVGQPLVKMETDKVVTDIPSPRTGVIAARYGKVGETIHVGETLVEIEIEGEVAAEAPSTQPEQVDEKGAGVVGTIGIGRPSFGGIIGVGRPSFGGGGNGGGVGGGLVVPVEPELEPLGLPINFVRSPPPINREVPGSLTLPLRLFDRSWTKLARLRNNTANAVFTTGVAPC